MFSLRGPEVGRRHDVTLLPERRWGNILQQSLNTRNLQLYVYENPTFLLRPWMQRPFYRDLATMKQVAFESATSKVRVAVEHNFKELKQFLTNAAFTRNLKARKASIAVLYKSSAIPLNLYACLYRLG